MLERYESSGRVSINVVFGAVAALVASVVLAWVYQKILWYSPLIILDALVVFGMAFALVILMSMALKMGKCRNRAISILLGLAVGAVALLATHWFSYTNNRSYIAQQIMEEAAQKNAKTIGDIHSDVPPEIAKLPLSEELISNLISFDTYLEMKLESGWTVGRRSSSGGGLAITGIGVWTIWVIEGGILIIAGFMGGLGSATDPYDETSDDWMAQSKVFSIPSSDAECQRLAGAQSVAELLKQPVRTKLSATEITYTLATPSEASEPHYLKVERTDTVKNNEGKDETKTSTLQDWVKLTAAEAKSLTAPKVAGAGATGSSGTPPPIDI